jgi:hypothetical protein
MRLKAFAIRDTKAEAFTRPPIFVQATGLAIRLFTDAANDQENEIGKYPADFTLFEVGEFDQVEGKLIPRAGGILELGNGLAFITQKLEIAK